ncbi:LuxR C-terminal-related transcriptional regulator [Deinococcus altitudinis]|uniref:LuxR C-terminal-related transcriptional regulator n=1 Tax=Deinococcus altitudinis TaxID=468914 RepID=UPI0038916703
MAPVLLGNKLHPPVLADHIIARPQLLALLDRGVGAKLILISSPAGTGKSTVLADWLKQQNSPTAWLSLDRGDDTLGQFLLYLIGALQTLGLGLGEGLSELLRQPNIMNVEPLLIQLSNDFARLEGRIVLILDDYHFLSDPKIHRAVEFLLDHLPPQVCLVIATRTDPPLSLSRLRVRNQLLEVRGTDLRFDLAEATRFLNGSQGLGLSTTAVSHLETQTEGWIAALQLAALSLTERPDKEAFVRAFVGSHRFLVDYLVDEVLSRQPAALKTFLQRTAILERFDTSLCEAVTGQPTDPGLLSQIEAANLFLIPLDDERRWYRFHHLFGEFLRHRLLADEPDLVPELHRRASAWFEQAGWTDDAIRHAFLAGDDHLAARLATDTAAQLAVRWNTEQFTRYFQRIPVSLMLCYPRLCLYYCWFLVTTSQFDAFKAALPTLKESRAHSPEPQTIDAAFISLQAYVCLHQLDFVNAAHAFQRALDLLGSGEQGSSSVEAQLTRIGTATTLSFICPYIDLRRAAALCSVNVALSRQFGSSIGIVNGTVGLARANHQMGRLHEAEQVLEQGLFHFESGSVDRAGTHRTGNVGELHVSLGRLHYEKNQLGEAEASVRRARASNELYGSAAVLGYELELSLRLFLVHGQVEAASAALHRLDRLSASVHRNDLLVKRTFEGMAMKSRVALAVYLSQTALTQPSDSQGNAQIDAQPSRLLAEVGDWLGSRELDVAAPSGSSLGGHEILARWLLARNEPGEAALLLERLIRAAQTEDRTDDLIQFLLLHALALHRTNRGEESTQALLRALDLGESEGYCRSFVDLGPGMQALLTQRAGTRPTPYLAALLAAFPNNTQLPAASEPPRNEPAPGRGTGDPSEEGSEAFNAREMEVLRLLEVGNTHKQIARELQLSPNTVRWYMKSLYVKLQVNNRTEALSRAKDMGMV